MMRAWFSLGALLLTMCLCGTASAQLATTTSNTAAVRPTNNQRFNDASPNIFLRARTRLREVFGGTSSVPNRIPLSTTTVPDPSSPEYFKPFEIRQLGGR